MPTIDLRGATGIGTGEDLVYQVWYEDHEGAFSSSYRVTEHDPAITLTQALDILWRHLPDCGVRLGSYDDYVTSLTNALDNLAGAVRRYDDWEYGPPDAFLDINDAGAELRGLMLVYGYKIPWEVVWEGCMRLKDKLRQILKVKTVEYWHLDGYYDPGRLLTAPDRVAELLRHAGYTVTPPPPDHIPDANE